MNPNIEWLKPGAKVRVCVQSHSAMVGTVEAVTDRGLYLNITEELYLQGYSGVKEPLRKFFCWNTFQSAELLEEAP